MNTSVLITLFLPFVGTLIGSGFVFFLKKGMPPLFQKALLGFASGVMIAAAVWSLLIPGMEMSSGEEVRRVIPAAGGFVLGVCFLLAIDFLTPHLHIGDEKPEGLKSRISRTAMLALAVTIHNIPEGAIISMPMRAAGNSRRKSFFVGALSGVVEPMGAVVVLLLASLMTPILPYFLAFAAGAMMYVVVEELIPEASEGQHSNIGTVGFAVGFVLMMVLDVALG